MENKERVYFSPKLNIKEEEVDSNLLKATGVNPAVALISEFSLNFSDAKTQRLPYEANWREVEKYVWNDIATTIVDEKTKQIKKVGETTQNLLFPIYQYKLAEILNQNDTDISIEPKSMPQGKFWEEVESAKKELQDKLKEGVSAGLIGKEEAELEYQEGSKEIEFAAMGSYINKVQEFSDIVKNIFNASMPSELQKRIYDDALISGTSYIEVINETVENGIGLNIKHLPVWNVYLDPSADSFESSRFIITKTVTTLDELLSNKELSSYLTSEIVDLLKNQTQRKKDNYGYTSGQTGINDKTLDFYRYYKKYLNEKNEIVYSIYYLVGNDATRPILLYAHKDTSLKRFPIAAIMLNKRTNSTYGKSLFDFLIPTQKLINKLEAIVKMRALLSARPQIFLSRRAGIDPAAFSSTKLQPGVVHLTNLDEPSKAVYVQQLDSIPGDFINFIDNAKANLNQISNVSDITKGQNSISGAKNGAVSQTLDRALIPEKLNTLDIKEFFKKVITIIIEYITENSDLKSMIYVDNKSHNKDYKIIQYVGSEYKSLDYNLNIELDIYTASEKAQNADKLMQLYQMGLQFQSLSPAVTEEELIEAMNLPNKKQALFRLQAAREQDNTEIAQQIIQFVSQAIMQGIQAQQEAELAQLDMEEGNMVNQNELAQPMPPEEMLSIVEDIIAQSQVRKAGEITSPSVPTQG